MAKTRGLYASILSTQLGKYVLPGIAQNILGDFVKELELISYMLQNKVTSVTLYDLNKILPDLAKCAQLSSLIYRLKLNGLEVHAALGGPSQVAQVAAFNNKFPVKFDGIVSELEFWNGTSATMSNDLIDLILMLSSARKAGLKTASYIGYLDRILTISQERITKALTALCDRILVHAYVKDPAQAAGYIKARTDLIRTVNPVTELWPIFSVEGPGTSTGEEIFMGDWWRANKSFQKVEDLVPGFYGYQWFEYGILRAYG